MKLPRILYVPCLSRGCTLPPPSLLSYSLKDPAGSLSPPPFPLAARRKERGDMGWQEEEEEIKDITYFSRPKKEGKESLLFRDPEAIFSLPLFFPLRRLHRILYVRRLHGRKGGFIANKSRGAGPVKFEQGKLLSTVGDSLFSRVTYAAKTRFTSEFVAEKVRTTIAIWDVRQRGGILIRFKFVPNVSRPKMYKFAQHMTPRPIIPLFHL